MSQILQRICSGQHFNVRNYKQIIEDKFVGVLLNVQGEDKPCHFWHDLAIHTVIKYELNKKLRQSKTRSKSAKIQMIKKVDIYVQATKKKENYIHLPLTDEINRSLSELLYVLDKLK